MTATSARPARRRSVGAFVRFLLFWLVGCWTVVGALLAPVVPGHWATIAGLILVTTAPLAGLFASRRGGRYPGGAFRLLVLRPFWYVQLLLPLAAAGGLLGSLGGLGFGALRYVREPVHHGWGTLVAGVAPGGRWTMLAVAIAAVLIGIVGYVASQRLVVRRVTAWWPDVPAALDGFRIVQISDTHVGPHTRRAHLRRAARAVTALEPHLIAVTGDLIDDHAPDVEHYARAFGALTAPHGVFAVPGNHDVYANWAEVASRLERLPMTVLVNESRTIEIGGARLAVIGTGDPAGGQGPAGPDIVRAMDDVPSGAFTLALAHNPALWPELAARGVRLTLSGHTHWGQFALPSIGWSLATPFLERAMGTHQEGASLLYIHPGTNYWGIPFRLGTPPEVALVTLRRGRDARIDMGDPEAPPRRPG